MRKVRLSAPARFVYAAAHGVYRACQGMPALWHTETHE